MLFNSTLSPQKSRRFLLLLTILYSACLLSFSYYGIRFEEKLQTFYPAFPLREVIWAFVFLSFHVWVFVASFHLKARGWALLAVALGCFFALIRLADSEGAYPVLYAGFAILCNVSFFSGPAQNKLAGTLFAAFILSLMDEILRAFIFIGLFNALSLFRNVASAWIGFAFWRLLAPPAGLNIKHVFHRLKILGVNFLLLFLGLLILEVRFGNWWQQNPLGRLTIPFDVKTKINISDVYPDKKNEVLYIRDPYGFRGVYPSLDKIDLLTLGGSTTAQTYIAEGETWQDVLTKNFRKNGKAVYVANAGLDGQSSYGHLRNFKLWFPHIPNLQPKFILVYLGMNDRGMSPRFYDDFFDPNPSWPTLYRKKSAVYLLYRIITGWYWKAVIQAGRYTPQPFGEIEWTDKPASEYNPALMKEHLDRYENRVRLLASRIQAMGARPVFVTQKTRAYRRVGDKILGATQEGEVLGVRINGVNEYYIMRDINQVTLKVCKEVGAICLDLATELRFEDKDFYDLEHNAPSGAAKIGNYLYAKLKNYF